MSDEPMAWKRNPRGDECDVTYVHAKRLRLGPVRLGWWVYEEGRWWSTGGWCPTWKIARHRMRKLG